MKNGKREIFTLVTLDEESYHRVSPGDMICSAKSGRVYLIIDLADEGTLSKDVKALCMTKGRAQVTFVPLFRSKEGFSQ